MSKNMRLWLTVLIGLAVFAAFVALYGPRGPDMSKYQQLKEPQLVPMDAQRMLVVEVKGDPGTTGKKAFGTLFRAYYTLKPECRAKGPVAPRARWPESKDTPRDQWVGRYALPVTESATTLPDIKTEGNVTIQFSTWEYGLTAEILHVGPYSEETPTIQRLLAFIDEHAYEVVGEHEEEYVKGPGMIMAGNPKNYVTIIRYRVKPKG
jgi:hypothetical protein